MTPTTVTIRPHELEPGDIIVDFLGQRVGGYDPPSLLLYAGEWHVWSSLDRKICTLPAGVEVEVIRNVGDEIVAEERPPRRGQGRHPFHYCVTCSDGESPGPGCVNCRYTGMDQTPCLTCVAYREVDDAPPHGIARVRGLLMVVPR